MVGASTVYGMTWLVVLLLPMLAIVQSISAHAAAASRMSLQQVIVRTYGRVPANLTLVAVASIGLLTLAADVKAGAEALTLLTGAPFYVFVIPFVAIVGWLLGSHSYLRIERILAWCTLIFVCYAASAILAKPDWGEVLRSIAIPHIEFSPVWLTGAIALLGTTLTSYEYFWESIEVAERRPRIAELRAFKVDAAVGMIVAGSSFIFILIATAATSGKHHLAIQTATDAAAALKPLAGSWDQTLFGIGLLASAAVATPIIAATNGYVAANTFGFHGSLEFKPREAPAFYRVVFASLAAAAALALLPVPTIALLYWVSVAAGIATPLTLAFAIAVARNSEAMNGRPIGPGLAGAGWAVTGVVTLASAAFLVSTVVK